MAGLVQLRLVRNLGEEHGVGDRSHFDFSVVLEYAGRSNQLQLQIQKISNDPLVINLINLAGRKRRQNEQNEMDLSQ